MVCTCRSAHGSRSQQVASTAMPRFILTLYASMASDSWAPIHRASRMRRQNGWYGAPGVWSGKWALYEAIFACIPMSFRFWDRRTWLMCVQIYSPGRFYSSFVIKLMLQHMLRHYEFELLEERKPNNFTWRSAVMPRTDLMVMLTRREKSWVTSSSRRSSIKWKSPSETI